MRVNAGTRWLRYPFVDNSRVRSSLVKWRLVISQVALIKCGFETDSRALIKASLFLSVGPVARVSRQKNPSRLSVVFELSLNHLSESSRSLDLQELQPSQSLRPPSVRKPLRDRNEHTREWSAGEKDKGKLNEVGVHYQATSRDM